MPITSLTAARSPAFAMALAGVMAATAACRDRVAEPAAPAAAASGPAASPAAGQPPLRLVVLIVVDQLPSWSFERDRAALTGGVAHLLGRGVYFASGEFPYASTYTASGHAALATGATPRLSGILANRWYDRAAEASHEATADPAHPVLAALPGSAPSDGQSSRFLLAPGVADALRSATGGRGRSVAISLKERSAILVAGQQADLAIWYDETQPAMTTSRFFVDKVPDWLVAFGRQHPISARFNEVWEPTDAELLARLTGNVDDGVGEGPGEGGLGSRFPHVPARATRPEVALVTTPMATDLLFDTAEAAIAGERLGADEIADLLAISVSSHDYAGHAWGQESWERLDLLLRLDRRLGEFLDHLDRTVGADQYAVVFTSDHGAVPLVERSRAGGQDAHRVIKREVIAAAEAAAAGVLGKPARGAAWIADYQANTIYLSAAFRGHPDRDRALEAMAIALRALPGVGLVAPTAALIGDCAARGEAERLACESIAPQLSGELWVATAEDSVLVGSQSTGTGHGSPSRADRVVPIVLLVPGAAPRQDNRPVSILRVAPTLARLLGVPPPALAAEPPLE
jgi:hypothetical protein